MFGTYKRSLDEAAGLATLLTMVLLDEGVYNAQRRALFEFVQAARVNNAEELGLATHQALCDLAHKMWKEGTVPLGVAGFLWKAREVGRRTP
jgi:hypothetical protein